MSYKKISLPSFMGADNKARTQEEGGNGKCDGAGGISREEPPVVRAAALKKLKSSRKKWFVLLGPTSSEPARLEYYDNERKWRAKAPPKRSIVLEKCFNINRKQDTRDARNKIVIALYTLDDCVSIVFETENELNDWLDQLLTLQQGKSGNIDGKKPVPNFEHMWTVTVKTFTPEENNFTRVNHLLGAQRLCVTSNSVKFFPVGSDHCVEFPHACIRCCAYNDRHFKLETGRNSPSGSGSLLIDCDDNYVTHHLHETMLKAMSNASTKEMYLKSNRNRSLSLSEAQRGSNSHNSSGHLGHLNKSRPLPVERNRTISEPPIEGVKQAGQITPEPGMRPPRPISVRYGSYSTSPSTGINPLSPISPVGSVSTGLSSDGTGSSNSINDPICNGDLHELSVGTGALNSYQPDVIPEESSGEISIEFNSKTETNNQTLPRAQPPRAYYHQKQSSLTDFTYDDYMDMGGQVPTPPTKGPPLPRRNYQANNQESSFTQSPYMTSPSEQSASSSYSSEYHIMSPSDRGTVSIAGSQTTPQISPSEDQNPYFDMERLNLNCGEPGLTSTPLKSTSSVTLVHPDSIDSPSNSSIISKLEAERASCRNLPARTPPVAIKSSKNVSSTTLTPPENKGVTNDVSNSKKTRNPSGEGAYVTMSPGSAPPNPEKVRSIIEEKSILPGVLEGSILGGGSEWRGSPRHSSPSSSSRVPRDKSHGGSKRNSSCLDDSEAHWEPWRYDFEPQDVSTDDIYHQIYYPGRNSINRPTPTPISRVSPASSSSAVSGTPSSDSHFTDFHDRLEKVSSYLREEEDDEERLMKRPPHSGRRSVHNPKYMEIPSSKSSSRSNVSAYGRTPPTGASNSPTVASRLEGIFRSRTGSMPTRPPIFERRRHRTQSEGEKDAVPPNP